MEVLVYALLLSALLTAPPTENPECVKYFHSACSEALGKWLPLFVRSNDFWDAATHVSRRDGFVYLGYRPRSDDFLGFQGPRDGTFFVYGNAGPPKGNVVYDYAHHIAFYKQGCCSWTDVVAAYSPPPPKRVVNRDLTALHTVRGIHLGMSPQQVQRVYGQARFTRVPGYPNVYVLAYTTWPPSKTVTIVHMPCGQFENFFFKHGRLIMIQLGNGC